MSWGGLIFRAQGACSVDELPNDYKMPSLGSDTDVRDRISELFPGHNHELGHSSVCDNNCWVEFSYQQEHGIVDSVGVRSNGTDWALGAILDVAENLGAKLFDNQNGDFVKSINDNTMENYIAWKGSLGADA